MEKNKIEIDKLVSQFASSANTLQQAYLSLENELLDTYLPETQETKMDYSELSESSIWEFRKNLIHVLDMMEQPVVVLNESMEIITQNNPAKIIYQIEEKGISSKNIFPKQSLIKLKEFLNSRIESKFVNLSLTPTAAK